MRKPIENIKQDILNKTLEILRTKEPYEIGLRDIAKECNISATTIMNYYQNKEALFRNVSLYNLNKLKDYMTEKVSMGANPTERLKLSLEAFRDWCFDNSKYALLFMGKVPVDENADITELQSYYTCNRMGQSLLEDCIKNNDLNSRDLIMETNIAIYGLWGCIESIILKRADIELWDKRIEYTDYFIEMFIKNLEK